MDELVKLREAVRAASGPDRALDGALAKALGLPHGSKDCVDMEARAEWTIPEIAQPVTASIDAALALCERVLPYMWLEIKFAGEEGPKRWPVVEHGYRGSEWRSQAATAPLAIILAVLTALLEKEAANEAE